MGALSHSLWDLLSTSLSTQLIVRLIVTDFTHHDQVTEQGTR